MHLPFDRNKTIFLIDGSSFLYKAYFSLPAMSSKNGRPVRVLYGFCRILKKLIDDFDPAYLAIAWDTPAEASRWRKKLYPLYKANRQAPPQELNEQRDLVKTFCSTIEVAQFEKTDEEADDVLYSLAKDFTRQGCCIVIVTQDKDFHQIIGKKVVTYDPFKEFFMGPQGVRKRYGLPINKLVFYYALIGDAIDNIPGVTGIGPHSALELAGGFGSLTNLYEHLHTLKDPHLANLLKTYKHDAFMSQRLFKLKYFPLNASCSDCKFDKRNWSHAYPLFKELGFNSLLNET